MMGGGSWENRLHEEFFLPSYEFKRAFSERFNNRKLFNICGTPHIFILTNCKLI
jgi:hypothetical protein